VFYESSKLVFIIIGVWLEANMLLAYNGDLNNRITTIDVDNWTHDKLIEVIRAGYPLLNINFPKEVEKSILESSQKNVGLLQEICYYLCEKYKINSKQTKCITIGTVDDVNQIQTRISESQASRYQNFLAKFSEGLGVTELQMYRWIAWTVIKASTEELRRGLATNVIFRRIKDFHGNGDTLQQGSVTQALQRVSKVQYINKIQPIIFDFSDGKLRVVDVNFILFKQTHSVEKLLEFIGVDESGWN
jgi:hypothetical protein